MLELGLGAVHVAKDRVERAGHQVTDDVGRIELETTLDQLVGLLEAPGVAVTAGLPEHRDDRLRLPLSRHRFQKSRQDHVSRAYSKIPPSFQAGGNPGSTHTRGLTSSLQMPACQAPAQSCHEIRETRPFHDADTRFS